MLRTAKAERHSKVSRDADGRTDMIWGKCNLVLNRNSSSQPVNNIERDSVSLSVLYLATPSVNTLQI